MTDQEILSVRRHIDEKTRYRDPFYGGNGYPLGVGQYQPGVHAEQFLTGVAIPDDDIIRSIGDYIAAIALISTQFAPPPVSP